MLKTIFISAQGISFSLPFTNQVLIFTIILLAIFLIPILLRKIGIPGILGLILAGIIIGPHGLHLLEKDAAIDLFSTIGLLYIMFLAGLELDLNDFRSQKNKSLTFGVFTFVIPLIVGFPVLYYILGYNFYASLLTASMFSTHTLLSYPVVGRLGITRNEAVAITVGGTIFTDTAVLVIFTIIEKSFIGELNGSFIVTLGISVALFVAVMAYLVPLITRYVFRTFPAEKYAQFIYVLFVVFLASFLAMVGGLEPIIGAFAAGLVLNRLISHTSPLMNRIEFAGNALFIPFFMISVGMLVDLSVITSGYNAWIVAGVLTLVALSGKYIAAWVTRLRYGYSKAQQQLIFGLSSSHAAATLAIITVGYKIGIIDIDILNGTIILILITCLVSTLVTEKASKQLIVAGEGENVSQLTSRESIVVPVSNPMTYERLMDLSFAVRRKKENTPISVISVVLDDKNLEKNVAIGKKLLGMAANYAAGGEVPVETASTVDIKISDGIERIAKEKLATLLIMGWPPSQKKMLDYIFGQSIDHLVDTYKRHLIIARIPKLLSSISKLHLFLPVHAHLEPGFGYCIEKVGSLAQSTNKTILCYCSDVTFALITNNFRSNKITAPLKQIIMEDWDQIESSFAKTREEDMIIVFKQRRKGISYLPVMDKLPAMLDDTHRGSTVFVYPAMPEDEVDDTFDV